MDGWAEGFLGWELTDIFGEENSNTFDFPRQEYVLLGERLAEVH